MTCYSHASRPSRMSHSCGRNLCPKRGRPKRARRWMSVLRQPLRGTTRPAEARARQRGLEAKGFMPLPQSIGLTVRAAKLALASLAVAVLLAACGGGSGPGPISSGRDRLDRRGEGRSAPAAHRLGQHALRRQGAEAGCRARAVRFRQSVGLARAERHQGHAGGRASCGAERDPGRRRADHRPALRARSRCRSSDRAPVEHSR